MGYKFKIKALDFSCRFVIVYMITKISVDIANLIMHGQ
jgi:hypothetical protein